MMEFVKLVQGTDEWHDFRRQHFMASNAAVVMGCAPRWWGISTPTQLRAYRDGGSPPEANEFAKRMQANGHIVEGKIREAMSTLHFANYLPAVVKRGQHAASLDGLCEASRAWIEVKAPKDRNSTVWKDAQIEVVPDYIWTQMAHQAHVLEGAADTCFYVVADPEGGRPVTMEFKTETLLRTWPTVEEAWERFRGQNAPQEALPQDVEAARDYIAAHCALEDAKRAFAEAKEALLADGVRDIPGYVTMSQASVQGRVDYKAIAEKHAPGIDLEEWRGNPSVRTTIKIVEGATDE